MPRKLNREHTIAASIISQGGTVQAAADEVGRHLRTVQMWRKWPEFRELVQSMVRVMDEEASRKLANHARRVIDMIIEVATDTKEDSIKIRAADLVLTHRLKYAQHLDLAERLDRLEELVTKGEDSNGSSIT